MISIRIVGGVAVGFICAAALARLLFGALQAAWPDYVSAGQSGSFTLPMLWSRLGVAAVLVLLSGLACTLVARDRRAAAILGGLFVLVSLPSHLYYSWAAFPVWYHAIYLLSLTPLAWLGGRLVTGTRTPAA